MNRYSRYRTFYYASMVKFCSNEKLKRVRVSRIYSLKYLFRSTLLWYITSFVFLRRETSFTAENFRLKNWFCPQSFVLPMRFSVVLLPMGFSVVLPIWGSLFCLTYEVLCCPTYEVLCCPTYEVFCCLEVLVEAVRLDVVGVELADLVLVRQLVRVGAGLNLHLINNIQRYGSGSGQNSAVPNPSIQHLN